MTLLQPQSQFTSVSATLASQPVAPPLKLPLATRGSPVPRGAPLPQTLLYTVTPPLNIPIASVMPVPPLKLAALPCRTAPAPVCQQVAHLGAGVGAARKQVPVG
ncbi:hypothetical protein N7501_006014 [Penicillium viridicatum]|nr:hypothetical protein N7501_006014 [Penicillium viridicatum]